MKRLAALLAVALLVSPTTALSQESDSSDRALLLILDASGSMGRVDANGVRLIDGAKQALLDLVNILPDDVQVGLRVYGHTYPNTDKVNGCTDTAGEHADTGGPTNWQTPRRYELGFRVEF